MNSTANIAVVEQCHNLPTLASFRLRFPEVSLLIKTCNLFHLVGILQGFFVSCHAYYEISDIAALIARFGSLVAIPILVLIFKLFSMPLDLDLVLKLT